MQLLEEIEKTTRNGQSRYNGNIGLTPRAPSNKPNTHRKLKRATRTRRVSSCSSCTYKTLCNQINTTDVTSGAGPAYPSGAPEFATVFSWGSCCSIFSFICMFCRSLFVLFLLAIVLSVLLRYTDSDYSFGIFKLFLNLQQ